MLASSVVTVVKSWSVGSHRLVWDLEHICLIRGLENPSKPFVSILVMATCVGYLSTRKSAEAFHDSALSSINGCVRYQHGAPLYVFQSAF